MRVMVNDGYTNDVKRALVVDDDAIARTVIAFALRHEGFRCDMAENGAEALTKLDSNSYDLVVTDLRMPIRHGYDLLCELLQRENRPVIMVHTAVNDPLLTRELLRRGIDDVSFKPGNYPVLALRARALVEDRRLPSDSAQPSAQSRKGEATLDREYVDRLCALEVQSGASETSARAMQLPAGLARVEREELRRRLREVTAVLPVSQAGLDVVSLIRDGASSARRVAAAVAREPSLAVEVLKLANSAYFNPSGHRIANLEQAVMRLGFRRVQELAVATATLTALTTNIVPWIDTTLVWRRSLAAALAADMLEDQRCPGGTGCDNEAFLPALLHGLGRLALAGLYPRHYELMVAECQRSKQDLATLERAVFTLSPAEVLAELLALWNLPVEAAQLLTASDVAFHTLATTESANSLARLVKTATLIGTLAVRKWEPWETLDIPPADWSLANTVGSWHDLVLATRDGVQRLATLRTAGTTSARGGDPVGKVAYLPLTKDNADPWLPLVAETCGIVLETVSPDDVRGDEPLVVRIDAPFDERQLRYLERRASKLLVVVAEGTFCPAEMPRLSHPCSVAQFRQALQNTCAATAQRHAPAYC